jgi:hypothetical protein
MSDLAAFYIAAVFAISFAPWYAAVTLLIALAWCVFMELP